MLAPLSQLRLQGKHLWNIMTCILNINKTRRIKAKINGKIESEKSSYLLTTSSSSIFSNDKHNGEAFVWLLFLLSMLSVSSVS